MNKLVEVPSVEPASYKPPFPDRIDLFAAPKRHDTQQVTSDGNSVETIHLVGSVNVNGPRAILSFNGVEMPIGEGGGVVFTAHCLLPAAHCPLFLPTSPPLANAVR